MKFKYGWLIVLVVAALLASACGPQEVAPTLGEVATAEKAETAVVGEEPTEEADDEPAASTELPIDEGDWHVLGEPDAPITIVEYSDFQ
jgi:hypothetical protein